MTYTEIFEKLHEVALNPKAQLDAYLAQGKKGAKYCAEEYGNNGKGNGYTKALYKEHVPILGHDFYYIFAESLKGHGCLLNVRGFLFTQVNRQSHKALPVD